LVHEYGGGRIPVAHLDFYRLRSAQEVWALGWEDLVAECIVVAEWGNLFPEVFPADSLHLIFREEADASRSITIGKIGFHMQNEGAGAS
jgi:tRNA threonylcarbamoyladenosine biosynthesis protein TsaE